MHILFFFCFFSNFVILYNLINLSNQFYHSSLIESWKVLFPVISKDKKTNNLFLRWTWIKKTVYDKKWIIDWHVIDEQVISFLLFWCLYANQLLIYIIYHYDAHQYVPNDRYLINNTNNFTPIIHFHSSTTGNWKYWCAHAQWCAPVHEQSTRMLFRFGYYM